MPLALSPLKRAIIDLLTERGPLTLDDLWSFLRVHYWSWDLNAEVTSKEVLRKGYLIPMWKQGLIAEESEGYVIGPQWELIHPYQKLWEEALKRKKTIEQLAKTEPWLECETIKWEQ